MSSIRSTFILFHKRIFDHFHELINKTYHLSKLIWIVVNRRPEMFFKLHKILFGEKTSLTKLTKQHCDVGTTSTHKKRYETCTLIYNNPKEEIGTTKIVYRECVKIHKTRALMSSRDTDFVVSFLRDPEMFTRVQFMSKNFYWRNSIRVCCHTEDIV